MGALRGPGFSVPPDIGGVLRGGARLPPFIFRQEYECSFEETEDQVFTTDMIDRAVTDEVQPLFGAVG